MWQTRTLTFLPSRIRLFIAENSVVWLSSQYILSVMKQNCLILVKIYWYDGHSTEVSTTNERIRREKRRSPCLSHLLLREQTTAPLSLKSLLLQLLNLMTQLSVTVLALITQVARWCRRRCSPRKPASPFKIFSWVSFTLSIFITKCTFKIKFERLVFEVRT